MSTFFLNRTRVGRRIYRMIFLKKYLRNKAFSFLNKRNYCVAIDEMSTVLSHEIDLNS